ncbi:DNA polymerase sliding clamp [Halococcus saccharolyticus]|uniref:DNA polymerase sliding clamp n=1 Tax=Halococcus saccharolyticus DSM 5350 TaxID=1227455 RepID=M0MQM0_9EURY|nr:DNA polymerase sliding clamp [Halococcus saccharolyticus]EMA47936.1 DNA polymerase sliding clamp [Halococcus saccharolyticus DSM 5350]
MSFKAITQAESIGQYLDRLNTVVNEGKIHCVKDGFQTKAVGPANVAMVSLSLDAEAFESYTGDGEVLGVNTERLADIVGMADAGDLVHLELNEETRKLEIEVGAVSYTLALIDPDSIRSEPDIPDLDLPAEIALEARDLKRGITAADMVSDHIALGVDADDEVFYVDADGDTDDVHVALGRDDLIDLEVGAAHSLYSLDYMKDMHKPWAAGDELVMRLGEEFPVMIDSEFAEGAGEATAMLAPRIQSE